MSETPPGRPRRDPRAERAQRTAPAPEVAAPAKTPFAAPRRDPRAERQARTARAPAEAAPVVAPPTTEAQPARLRRDPRADRRAPRGGEGVPVGAASVEPGPDVIRVEGPGGLVAVVASLEAGALSRADREALGAGRALADSLDAALLLIVCVPQADDLRLDAGAMGADRLMVLANPGFGGPALLRGPALVAAAEGVRHLIFAPDALELARRVAVRLGDRGAFAVVKLSGDTVTVLADGGRSEWTRPTPRVLALAPDRFDPVGPGARREARPLPAPQWSADDAVTDMGLLPMDPAAIPLREAEFILAAGNGISDWDRFHRLARALGAAEAGSRVVCDNGDLPRDRQIGASGVIVAPRCYMALGISGASQHLDGIVGVEHVVAINRDPHAEMLKRAGLAIVGDAQAVMPALLEKLGEPG